MEPYWANILWVMHLFIVFTIQDVATESNLHCNESYYLTRSSKNESISCDYDRSFYTVAWYFNDEDDPFLRIDGDIASGSGYDSGEFDINEDGSMVIINVDANHEGRYKIAVLQQDGITLTEVILVYIIVPLTDLRILDCKASLHDQCVLQGRRETTTLLCVAENTLPKVELKWLRLHPNGSEEIPPSSTPFFTFNETSKLYTTFLSFEYSSRNFTLQYFTCVATGNAVRKESNVSLLVKGELPFIDTNHEPIGIHEGKPFRLKCSNNSFPFRQIRIKNGIDNSKPVLYTHHVGNCFNDKCDVSNDGVYLIENFTFIHEGSYECISSNGLEASSHISNVIVIITPENSTTVFEECATLPTCSRITSLTGSLNCLVVGVKPEVKLSIYADGKSNEDIVIVNTYFEVVHQTQSKTYSTYLSADYKMTKYSTSVKIRCSTVQDRYKRDIKSSYIYLESIPYPEKNTNVILPIVVAVIATIIGCIVVVFVIHKYKTEHNPASNDAEDPPSEAEAEGLLQNAEPSNNSKEVMEMNIQLVCLKILNNEVTDEEFSSFLENCSSEEQILNSMDAFISTSKETNQLSADKLLQITEKLHSLEKITTAGYARITTSIVTEYKDDFEIAFKELISSPKYIEQNMPTELLKLLNDVLDTKSDAFKEEVIEALAKSITTQGIFLRVLLLSVENKMTEVAIFIDVLNGIWDKIQRREYRSMIGESFLSKDIAIEILRATRKNGMETDSVFTLQMANKLEFSEYLDELKKSMNEKIISEDCFQLQIIGYIHKEKLSKPEIIELVTESLKTKMLSNEPVIEILRASLEKGLISEEDMKNHILQWLEDGQISKAYLQSQVYDLMQNNQISIETLGDILRACLAKRMITKMELKQQMKGSIKNDMWTSEKWIQFISFLTIQFLIEMDVTLSLITCVLEKYKDICKDDLKTQLETSAIGDKNLKKIMKDNQITGLLKANKKLSDK